MSSVPPGGTPPPDEDPARLTTSPWSVEHYGFDDHTTQPAPPERTRSTAPVPERRRSTRLRVMLASAALALGLTAGGTGFAVAQASTGDGRGPDRTVAAQLTADRGPDAHDGRGGPDGPGGGR